VPEPRIITLDGPAGVGKSTMARRLAESLGLAYLDTGAMFRAVAWKLGAAAEILDGPTLSGAVAAMRFDLEGQGAATALLLDGNRLCDGQLRTEVVGLAASTLAKRPEIRLPLKEAQQRIGQLRSLVAEGRDMGTVVFPLARPKFFLDATAEERARLRFLQLVGQGVDPGDFQDLVEAIRKRDDQDRNREHAPLKPAPEAVVIDTTSLSQEEVFQALLQEVESIQ